MMKAISLWNPWAYLVWLKGHPDPEIVKLGKGNETRSWYTSYRGPLAIHAAKNFPREARELCLEEPFLTALTCTGLQGTNELPCGAVVATCQLVGCLQITGRTTIKGRIVAAQLDSLHPLRREVTGNELAFGDYTPGRYAWMLEDVKQLPEPIPARGMQGLWEWEVLEGVKLS